MQDRLDHVLLERLGHDRCLAAAAEVRAAGADVAAGAVVTRARDELAAAVVAAKQEGKQVAAGAAVRSPVGVVQLGAQALRLGRRDDRRPLRLSDDFALVLALAADPGRNEHALERLRGPAAHR